MYDEMLAETGGGGAGALPLSYTRPLPFLTGESFGPNENWI